VNPATSRAQTVPRNGDQQRPAFYRTAGVLRVLTGVFFVFPAMTKFLDHGAQTELFESWGFPAPGAVVVAVGVLELVAGLLLAAGFLMPLPALLLLVNMVGALATAGVQDGGQNLFLPIFLIVFLVFILTRWGGAYQRGNGLRRGRGGGR
jgi:putative oxidoreductase